VCVCTYVNSHLSNFRLYAKFCFFLKINALISASIVWLLCISEFRRSGEGVCVCVGGGGGGCSLEGVY
jgi:hypothetical protein